ncbi:S-layer homology domain-containing protein [Paenibacillus cymbidii]|uniref:S-layer homology domain-containing protein n=1 Tax=Paenibacillus cymbidii TaxID=1639034 RepID=UPI00107FDD89
MGVRRRRAAGRYACGQHRSLYEIRGVCRRRGSAGASVSGAGAARLDIGGHWAEALIREAAASGVVGGYPDRTFRPDAAVTRAELAVLLARGLGLAAADAESSFGDAAAIPLWAAPGVAAAAKAGIVDGYDDGTFRAERTVTRAELAAMAARALRAGADGVPAVSAAAEASAFVDAADIPAWAQASVAFAAAAGLFEGRGDNRFVPTGETTRAEAVKIVLALTKQRAALS